MTHNVTLPNGFTMTGVPDDATQIEIAKHAVSKGYATQSDFTAYPDVYSQLAQAGGVSKPPSIKQTGNAVSRSSGEAVESLTLDAQALQQSNPIAAASMGMGALQAQSGKWIGEHPQAATAAAAVALAPVTGGLSLPTAYAADAGSSLALDSAAHSIETDGKDAFPEHPFLDVVVPIPGLAGIVAKPVAKAVGITAKAAAPAVRGLWNEVSSFGEDIGVHGMTAIAKPILKRLSPAVVQYTKGRLSHNPLPEDVTAATERYVDEAPDAEQVRESVQSGEKADDRVTALTAEQAEWLDQYNVMAGNRLVGVEAESYLLNVLKPDDLGVAGKNAADSLAVFRDFTGGYENPHLPFPGEERPELSGYGQFEQIMRASHPKTDELIGKIDAGEDVSPQDLYNSVASFVDGTRQNLDMYLEKTPRVMVGDLLGAIHEAPNITEWLDARGVIDPERRSYISAKQSAAHRAGIADAYAAQLEKLNDELTRERALTSGEYEAARTAGERNKQTALKHKLKMLKNMQENIVSVMNDAGGIKSDGVKWKDINEDARAVYWAMTHTHEGARRGAKAMRMYEQFEALRAALPGVRAATVTDQIMGNGIAKVGAGFMFGGLPGAILAPAGVAATEKAAQMARRKVSQRVEKQLLEDAAKKIN